MDSAPVATASSVSTTSQSSAPHSILAADFGSVNTRVVLLDTVSGQYRLVSRAQTLTTDALPLADVGIGLHRALVEIATESGRTLLNEQALIQPEQPEGGGVDLFLATASGGRPMKVVLVGLMPDVSLATARRTLASTYVELGDVLSLADVRSTQDQVNAILRSQPDLVFIVGGTNFGANDSVLSLIKTVRLAVLLARGNKPVVLYAGNEALQPTVRKLFGEEVSLFMADNIRPTLTEEKLDSAELELAMVYGTYKSLNAGGFSEMQQISRLGVLPTAQSYRTIVRYLGALPGAGDGVMCVDVGSSTVTICANFRKQPYVTIRPDLGLGHSAVTGLKAIGGPRNVLRWLTFEATEGQITDYVYNKSLYPATIPQTPEELEIESALAREFIRTAVAGARASWKGIPRGDTLPAMHPIIGTGAVLAQASDPGIGALLLLDALQPVGISEVWLDPYGMVAALGGLAYVEPLAVVELLDTGGLANLGTAICPAGKTRAQVAMNITVRVGKQSNSYAIANGMVQFVELPSGQKAQVNIKLSSGLTLNGKREVNFTASAGAAGLIADGRGRPFTPPRELARRAQIMPRWYAAMRSSARTT